MELTEKERKITHKNDSWISNPWVKAVYHFFLYAGIFYFLFSFGFKYPSSPTYRAIVLAICFTVGISQEFFAVKYRNTLIKKLHTRIQELEGTDTQENR